MLRGQRVFARARADGALDERDGRVDVVYGRSAKKVYRASAANLAPQAGELWPDDHCQIDSAAEPSNGKPQSKTAKKREKAKAYVGPDPHPADAWIAYTDGACSGNPGPCGAGVVVLAPGGAKSEGYAWLGRATNNVGELTAILIALESIPLEAHRVIVHTDSQYAIGVLVKGWKAKANVELIQQLKEELAKRDAVDLVYVPGHSGVPLNERADELAREAITMRHSKPLGLD